MKTIGNVLWFIVVDFGTALGWLFWALILAVTVIGLPFARQCVKMARFSAWPFGRQAINDPTASKLGTIGAVLWFIPGLFMAIGYVVGGAVLCITIIGFPFGLQSIKLAGLALAPFGKKIVRARDVGQFVAVAPA